MLFMSLESLVKSAKMTLLGALLIGSSLLAQDTTTLQGNIKSQPFNVPVKNGTVLVKNKQGAPLGTTKTDSLGNYTLNFVPTNVKDKNPELINHYKLTQNYPNPYNPSTMIDFYTPESSNFTATVYAVTGEKIASKEFYLNEGKHTFNLEGLGSAGVKILSITGDNGVRTTQKMIQLDGTNRSPSIDLISNNYYSFNLNKSTLSDSVRVLFSANNHQTDSVLVAVEPLITLNYDLQQIPLLKTATIQGNITNQQTQENVKNASVKVVDSDNNNVLVNVNTNNSGVFSGNYQYKLWLNGLDSITSPSNITTTLSKNNYETKILNNNFSQNITLNEAMNNLGVNFNFNIVPFDVNGVVIDSLTLHLQKNNGNAVFSKGPNNKINVNFTDYHDTPDSVATLSHLNPDYLQWLIGRTPQQPLNAYNLFQTTRADTNNSNPNNNPLVLPKINLENINNLQEDIHMYLIPKRIQHPFLAGQYLTMDGDTANYMMRRDWNRTAKFMPSVASDTTDCVVFKWNFTTGLPVPESKIQNTLTQFQKVLDAYTLANGVSLLNYNLVAMADTTNAEWLFIKNRGFDNLAYSSYENIITPSNGLSYGQPPGRIKNSLSRYDETESNATIFTEIYEQMVGNRDPEGPGGSAGYVYKDGNMSQYGKILLRMRALMNPATPY